MAKMNTGVRRYRKAVVVLVLSIGYLLSLYAPLFRLAAHTPSGKVNMMVAHYYEDYYEYLSFIKQGQMRKPAVENLFTTDDPSKILVPWWPFLLIGWISSFSPVALSVMHAYWISSVLLTGIYLLLLFRCLQSLFTNDRFIIPVYAFILFLCSSSLFTLEGTALGNVSPITFWGSSGSPFARMSAGTPQHQMGNIVFLVSVLVLAKGMETVHPLRTTLRMFISSALLLTLSSAQLVILWGGYSLSVLSVFPYKHWRSQRQMAPWLMKLLPVSVGFVLLLPAILFLKRHIASSPILSVALQGWDTQQIFYPSVLQFLLSHGVLFFLAPFGVYGFLKNGSSLRRLAISIFLFSLIMMLVPLRLGPIRLLEIIGVHNGRFNIPIVTLVAAAVAVSFLQRLLQSTWKMTLATVILLLIFSPSTFAYWRGLNQNPAQWNIIFMPESMYRSFGRLNDLPVSGAVLTSPAESLGLVVPALSGRRVYFGRSIFTLDMERKREDVEAFYRRTMDAQIAEAFLKRHDIAIILLSKSDPDEMTMRRAYPFLQSVKDTSELTVLYVPW